MQRYSRKINEPQFYTGQSTEHDCTVSMPQQVFQNMFRFCYLSGFNLYEIGQQEMIECAIQQRDDEYLFVAGGDDTLLCGGQVMCCFTCIGGEER